MSVLWFIPLQVSHKLHNVWVWVLYCLMTPGLNKDIRCHVSPYSFPDSQITRSDFRRQVKLDVSLMIVDGHFLHTSFCGYGLVKIRYHPKSCIMFGTLNWMIQIKNLSYSLLRFSAMSRKHFITLLIFCFNERVTSENWFLWDLPFIERLITFYATLFWYFSLGMKCSAKCIKTIKFDWMLLNDAWCKQRLSLLYIIYISKLQIARSDQTTGKVANQINDCRWLLQCSSGACVGTTYRLPTYRIMAFLANASIAKIHFWKIIFKNAGAPIPYILQSTSVSKHSSRGICSLIGTCAQKVQQYGTTHFNIPRVIKTQPT